MKNEVEGRDVIVAWMKLVVIVFTISVVIIAAMVLFQLIVALFKAPWVLVGLLVLTIGGITYKRKEVADVKEGA
jgi:hypothetical protein